VYPTEIFCVTDEKSESSVFSTDSMSGHGKRRGKTSSLSRKKLTKKKQKTKQTQVLTAKL